ncbi:hypothetical protein NC651_018216 [Populus alba x Populus x berolinensis]|nr:hypothetical protein NC651_018216 [Populus alba x Populus x berolinensis]
MENHETKTTSYVHSVILAITRVSSPSSFQVSTPYNGYRKRLESLGYFTTKIIQEFERGNSLLVAKEMVYLS